jgi:hypothetical protein
MRYAGTRGECITHSGFHYLGWSLTPLSDMRCSMKYRKIWDVGYLSCVSFKLHGHRESFETKWKNTTAVAYFFNYVALIFLLYPVYDHIFLINLHFSMSCSALVRIISSDFFKRFMTSLMSQEILEGDCCPSRFSLCSEDLLVAWAGGGGAGQA